MTKKGFENNISNTQTLENLDENEKSSQKLQKKSNRVDINVLKSKLQESENKELRRNIYILFSLVLVLGILGVYLSF